MHPRLKAKIPKMLEWQSHLRTIIHLWALGVAMPSPLKDIILLWDFKHFLLVVLLLIRLLLGIKQVKI